MRGAFVAAADEHEHQVGGLGVERDVADLVDDQQRDPLQAGELVVEAAWRWASASRATHSVAVRNATRWPARQARIAQRDREVGLAGAGRAEQDDVLAAGEEVELAEVLDQRSS